MPLDIFHQLGRHGNFPCARLQEHVVVLGIHELYVELGPAIGTVLGYRGEVVGNHLIEILGIHHNGKSLHTLLLDRLQVLDITNGKVHETAVGIFLHTARRDIDRTSHGKHSAPSSPLLAEEGDIATAFIVFHRDEATGLARLCHCRAHLRDDAAKLNLRLLRQRHLIVELRAVGVAHLVEDDLVVVERMCRQVDAHQVAFLVEPLYGAPLFHLWNRRVSYVDSHSGTEEGELGFLLLPLVVLSETQQGIENLHAFGILAEVLLSKALRLTLAKLVRSTKS